jgi:hypothetical protein
MTTDHVDVVAHAQAAGYSKMKEKSFNFPFPQPVEQQVALLASMTCPIYKQVLVAWRTSRWSTLYVRETGGDSTLLDQVRL